MKEFNWEDFQNKKIAVICKTSKEAFEFIKCCYDRDMTWANKKIHTNFEHIDGEIGYTCENKRLGFSRLEFYLDNGYDIVYWSDYNKSPKDMLKDGMVVEIMSGTKYLCLQGCITREEGYILMDSYDEDLNHDFYENYTIMKIFKPTGHSLRSKFIDKHLELIWEREPAKEMTKAEIEKELGYKIKIID